MSSTSCHTIRASSSTRESFRFDPFERRIVRNTPGRGQRIALQFGAMLARTAGAAAPRARAVCAIRDARPRPILLDRSPAPPCVSCRSAFFEPGAVFLLYGKEPPGSPSHRRHRPYHPRRPRRASALPTRSAPGARNDHTDRPAAADRGQSRPARPGRLRHPRCPPLVAGEPPGGQRGSRSSSAPAAPVGSSDRRRPRASRPTSSSDRRWCSPSPGPARRTTR